ncbi:hypothetical protein SAMN05660845_0446 [Flavobacterium swingsii]|jgi:hypothetical protein|uniref:TonB-dependent Receptor Plug Domain n=1 Tax=Flavobacterium swingsii TaxID=498292 RepID=A0A1I0VKD0_9FLAO|nr:hypothetical protein [Flavobacterium swingsii]SFA76781.1 hypothetical protein SAMN05660845_0446 [Flavobacterium swingsii]
MKTSLSFFIFLTILFSNIIKAQDDLKKNEEGITKSIENYYKLDRENIHLQLNKSTYLTEEKIWFKGYIIEKKSKKPYAKTSNVFVSLIDEHGKNITTKLYFAENSTFEGDLVIDKNFKSGIYYLQVFTNYMNNFTEDESSIYKIFILNPLENNYINPKKINFNTLDVLLYPESGVFLEGVSNTFGVKISDCNENGIIANNVEILDSKGSLITSFSTDNFGYGKFVINNPSNQLYKLAFEINGKKTEKHLPNVTLSGYNMAINNYTLPNKAIVTIRSNKRTISSLTNDSLALLVHQNDNAFFLDVIFEENKSEKTLILSNDLFLSGINTITLIDKKLNKIAERVIYKPLKSLDNTKLAIAQIKNGTVDINGFSPLIFGELSISILPNESQSTYLSKPIFNSFLFDNYLINENIDSNYFLNDFSKSKHAQLDNQLITLNAKYDFNKLLNNIPEDKFSFDQGLTIKGRINDESLKNSKGIKINLCSPSSNLNEFSDLNEKNEYVFENIMAIDSSFVHFKLSDLKGNNLKLKQYSQILNNNRKFIKPFVVKEKSCILDGSKVDEIEFPKLWNSIILDSVNISSGIKTKKLKYASNRLNQGMADGFKITDDEAKRFIDIISFIQFHGYQVNNSGIDITVSSRRTSSLNSSSSPALFIDNTPSEFNQLYNLSLSNVDEIYFNKSGYGLGSMGANGSIMIYTKKNFVSTNNLSILSKSFKITNGFQPIRQFENPKYNNVNDKGFKNFGTIYWNPKVLTNESGQFHFSFPNLFQKSVKIIIEGISSDGEMISEIKILDIK